MQDACTIANSGQECLDFVKKQNFDLIILDMGMTKMSGVDVLRRLKEIISHGGPR